MPTVPARSSRRGYLQVIELTAASLVVLLAAACSSEQLTETQETPPANPPSFAPPPNCGGQVNLVITMAEDQSGTQAIRGDASPVYAEGVAGVGAHTSAANGNLILTLQNAPTRRYAWTASSASGLSDDRLYTNSHTNPGGNNSCGLAGMANGSTGSSVFEAELLAGASNIDVIRYGKTCSGAADAATRVTTTRSADGNTWTISGSSGRYCTKLSSNKLQQSGTTGAFSMTLAKQ
jgi:hypothetical protein